MQHQEIIKEFRDSTTRSRFFKPEKPSHMTKQQLMRRLRRFAITQRATGNDNHVLLKMKKCTEVR